MTTQAINNSTDYLISTNHNESKHALMREVKKFQLYYSFYFESSICKSQQRKQQRSFTVHDGGRVALGGTLPLPVRLP